MAPPLAFPTNASSQHRQDSGFIFFDFGILYYTLRIMKKIQILFSATFWVYHTIYLLAFAFFVPTLIGEIQNQKELIEFLTLGGDQPLNLVMMVYIFFLLPLFTIIFSFVTKIYKIPKKLLMIFFGAEIPLMMLALIRIFIFREITPVMWVFIISIALSIVGLFSYLFIPKVQTKTKQLMLLFSQEVALLIASYVFLLFFFFLPIILALFLQMLNNFNIFSFIDMLINPFRTGNIIASIFFIFLAFLYFSTVFAFAISPIGGFIVYWSTYKNIYKKVTERFGKQYTLISQILFGAGFILLIVFLSFQTNPFWYTKNLNIYKKAQTFEKQKEIAEKLYSKDSLIKESLVRAYLASYRYLTDEKMNLLKFGYANQLQASDETAQNIQKLFNNVALPFVYTGRFEEDVIKAAEDYKELFDNSIQVGEKAEIIKSLKATNTNDSIKAGLLDRENTSVLLVNRQVNVTPYNNDLFAKVTIEEEYENVTKRQQEVYYEFFLPENAVPTELVLGPDLQFGTLEPVPSSTPTQAISNLPTPTTSSIIPKPTVVKKQVDTATIAPKGAAQLTYDEQIRIRIDPALLEQTGPRQYKLRVFPIPAKGFTFDQWKKIDYAKGEKDIRQKVRFSYITIRTKDGIPLPIITDRRNVFSNNNTKTATYVAGNPVTVKRDANVIPLSSDFVCSTDTIQQQTVLGTALFIPHKANAILTNDFSCDTQFSNAEKRIKDKKIALLLDVSYSTKGQNWKDVLENQFPIEQLITDNIIDVYFFTNKVSQKMRLTKETLTNLDMIRFGKTDRTNALLSIKDPYDALFMVTDDSTFDEKHKDIQVRTKIPTYIIHTENIPAYSEGLTSFVLQTNGKVFENGWDAITHLWLTDKLKGQKQVVLGITDFGTWILIDQNTAKTTSSPVGQLATKQLLYYRVSQTPSSTLTSLTFLDQMQSISQASSIVTPYSSMIVLVTEQQKRDLQEALRLNNRFSADINLSDDGLFNPSGSGIMEVSSVPEPHEWVLMITAGFLIFVFYRKKIYALLSPVYENISAKRSKQ